MKKTNDAKEFLISVKNKFFGFARKNSVYGAFAAAFVLICTVAILSIPSGEPDESPTPLPTEIVDAMPTVMPSPTSRPTQTARPTSNPTPTNMPMPTLAPLPTELPLPTLSPLLPTPTPDVGTSGGNETEFSIKLPFDKSTVITEYSNSVPIYSDTLEEWRCHVGLDFKCEPGAEVKSAADGIVYEIVRDDIYGTSVYVQHSDGFYTMYRGIENVVVKPDELIRQGQSIGTAANAIPYEAHMPTHIHFELIKNGLSADPFSFAK